MATVCRSARCSKIANSPRWRSFPRAVLSRLPSDSLSVCTKVALSARTCATLTRGCAELPGGVHLKTLQVYDTIFRRIGPELIVRDLSLYSAGLFPLYRFALDRCACCRAALSHVVNIAIHRLP